MFAKFAAIWAGGWTGYGVYLAATMPPPHSAIPAVIAGITAVIAISFAVESGQTDAVRFNQQSEVNT